MRLVVVLDARQVITQVAVYHVGATITVFYVTLCVLCMCVCAHMSGMCASKISTLITVSYFLMLPITNSQNGL